MAEFGLLQQAAIAGGAGIAYGAGYVGTKYVRGEIQNNSQLTSELASNTVGGVASGVGGYLLANAVTNLPKKII